MNDYRQCAHIHVANSDRQNTVATTKEKLTLSKTEHYISYYLLNIKVNFTISR